jgi:hypothetical protein
MLTKNLVVEVWCELWLRHRLECLYMVVLSALVCVQWTGVGERAGSRLQFLTGPSISTSWHQRVDSCTQKNIDASERGAHLASTTARRVL